MKKSILYSTIIMLSSAIVFPAATDTPHEATDASITELRAKLDDVNAHYDVNAHCTYLPDHKKKEAYFFYDEERPYLAISVIRNMQMHKKEKGINVFHEMRTFPGGVLFGLFEGADDRMLHKVASEFLDSFDQKTMHTDCNTGWDSFTKNIEKKIQAFGRADIEQDKKDLNSDDPAVSLRAFKNQWRCDSDKVKMHLVVALAYKRAYMPDNDFVKDSHVFIWEADPEAIEETIKEHGLIYPVQRGDNPYDENVRFFLSNGIKDLQSHQSKNVLVIESLKNVSCNVAHVLMEEDKDMLLPEYRTHMFALFDEKKFKKSICWDEVPVVVKKEKA